MRKLLGAADPTPTKSDT